MNVSTFAQTKTFIWRSTLCRYEGEYDSSKTTEAQLHDTYLLHCFNASYMEARVTAWAPEDIPKLNLDSLHSEYKTKLKFLKQLNIINSQFWETVRQNKIHRLSETYNFDKTVIKAYKNPSVLKSIPANDSCYQFVDAMIAGGDQLLNLWKQVSANACKNNGDSIQCIHERYLDKINSPQKLLFAQIELILFGWWNCANSYSQYRDNQGERIKIFNELFTNVKVQCGE